MEGSEKVLQQLPSCSTQVPVKSHPLVALADAQLVTLTTRRVRDAVVSLAHYMLVHSANRYLKPANHRNCPSPRARRNASSDLSAFR